MTDKIQQARRAVMNDSEIPKRIRYEPETGRLIWLRTGNKMLDLRMAGKVAGSAFQNTKSKKAYIVVRFNGSIQRLAHRIEFSS